MKLRAITFACCLLFFVVQLRGQEKIVSIRIGQEETVLLEKYESSIVLERKSFKIQVLLQHVTGVYVFAAFSDSLCCRLSELDTIPDFGGLPSKVINEGEFNKDKELLVNDQQSCGYWYYEKGKSWQGFNKKVVILDSAKVVAVKTVKQLYYLPDGKEIKLKDIKRPLYLFFIAVDQFDKDGHPVKELMRKKVRIDWVDEK